MSWFDRFHAKPDIELKEEMNREELFTVLKTVNGWPRAEEVLKFLVNQSLKRPKTGGDLDAALAIQLQNLEMTLPTLPPKAQEIWKGVITRVHADPTVLFPDYEEPKP